MEKIYDIFERYRDYILVFILFVIIAFSEYYIYYYIKEDLNSIKSSLEVKQTNEISSTLKDDKKKKMIYVDVKGEVSSPGVYSFEEGKRVIDALEKAGGITSKADTSVNNLGKKLTDEMVIIIYSKKEVKKMGSILEKKTKALEKCIENSASPINSCLDTSSLTDKNTSSKNSSSNGTNSSKTKNGKVSINTASKEELMTLQGIGEAKAEAIIEYRNKTKFNDISDIKNVKGIGDSIFEKIKNNITT